MGTALPLCSNSNEKPVFSATDAPLPKPGDEVQCARCGKLVKLRMDWCLPHHKHPSRPIVKVDTYGERSPSDPPPEAPGRPPAKAAPLSEGPRENSHPLLGGFRKVDNDELTLVTLIAFAGPLSDREEVAEILDTMFEDGLNMTETRHRIVDESLVEGEAGAILDSIREVEGFGTLGD